MSRTIRRRKMRAKDIYNLHYLYSENDVHYRYNEKDLVISWGWMSDYKFETYEDYRKDAISRFHRDSDDIVLSYNRAPWFYCNIRNRKLRRKHKNELKKCFTKDPESIMLEPFIRNAGWDFW